MKCGRNRFAAPVVEMFRKRRRQGGAAEAETFLAQAMIRSLPHNVRRFLLQCIHHPIGPSPIKADAKRGHSEFAEGDIPTLR